MFNCSNIFAVAKLHIESTAVDRVTGHLKFTAKLVDRSRKSADLEIVIQKSRYGQIKDQLWAFKAKPEAPLV